MAHGLPLEDGQWDLRGGWWYLSGLPKYLSFLVCKDFDIETSKMKFKMRLFKVSLSNKLCFVSALNGIFILGKKCW